MTVTTSSGMEQRLQPNDTMLKRIGLAYALNAHMAQGLTADKGIAVMDSRERRLLSQRNFLVTISRVGRIATVRGFVAFPRSFVAWLRQGFPSL